MKMRGPLVWAAGLFILTAALLLWGLSRALLTGQGDPWLWALPVAALMPPAGWLLGRRGLAQTMWVAFGAAGLVLVFCAVAAGRWPGALPTLGIAALALLATGCGALVARRRWRAAVLFGALAALLLWRGPVQSIQTITERPTLAVISGLPLFWAEDGSGLDGPVDAPIVTILRTRFDVRPLDDPRDLEQVDARLLLLAQPRALEPEALVAIDRWVRAGGRALLLADPLLRWPSPLPPGDRRRPPSVHLLDPLLSHWGATEASAIAGETRRLLSDGQLLTLWEAGTWSASDRRCRRLHDGLLLDCAVGRGRALLLADADLIDDRLWLADPARPLDPGSWTADTPALVVRWLGGDMDSAPAWFRSLADLQTALRWTFLAMAGWAIAGAALIMRQAYCKNKS